MSEGRTYTREIYERARREWDEGEFGAEWQPYRRFAAVRGFILPPDGSRWDSWEDAEPSQRAIVYRAIEDTPALLRRAIGASRSWGQVVAVLMRELEALRETASLAERDAEWGRGQQPDRAEARFSLAAIADILAGTEQRAGVGGVRSSGTPTAVGPLRSRVPGETGSNVSPGSGGSSR